jgi:hypothetical protein
MVVPIQGKSNWYTKTYDVVNRRVWINTTLTCDSCTVTDHLEDWMTDWMIQLTELLIKLSDAPPPPIPPLLRKLSTGHDPDSVLPTSHPHYLFRNFHCMLLSYVRRNRFHIKILNAFLFPSPNNFNRSATSMMSLHDLWYTTFVNQELPGYVVSYFIYLLLPTSLRRFACKCLAYIRRAQVKVGLINLCKYLFSLNANEE